MISKDFVVTEDNTVLEQMLAAQKRYNDKIREGNDDPTSWTQTYLLGMVSEINQVLDELNWKKHRRQNLGKIDRVNMAMELADLTKYVFSLWEVWGYSSQDIVEIVSVKSAMLDLQSEQEKTPIPDNGLILITDIDGTISDYRKSFIRWLRKKGMDLKEDSSLSLMMDSDLSIQYPEYNKLKDEFERGGGYADLLPYPDGVAAVYELAERYGAFVIAHTARPVKTVKRIWWDSWLWLIHQGLTVDKLLFGAETRIILGNSCKSQVIMFEDNPDLILREANAGLTVIARRHPYNEHIKHENVILTNNFRELDWRNLVK